MTQEPSSTSSKAPSELVAAFLSIGARAPNLEAESDRGMILVAGAIIDEQLRKILEAFLATCGSTTDLLKPSRPLGNAETRLQLAYVLGLLTKNDLEKVEFIFALRNIAAHLWEPSQIDEILAELKRVDRDGRHNAQLQALRDGVVRYADQDATVRTVLEWQALGLTLALMLMCEAAAKQKRLIAEKRPAPTWLTP